MTAFRYELPESEPTSAWSGLSDEAKIALTRTAMGPSAANQLLTPDGNGIEGLSPEVASWATADLETIGTGMHSWYQYHEQLGVAVPTSLTELAANNPNLDQALTRLYEAKQALVTSGEVNPENLNIGETMHLVLVPWQEIRNHLADFDQWVKTLRTAQGAASRDDYINPSLLSVIQSDQSLYRDPTSPFQRLSPSQYLDRKIAEDGPWGIILTQTSPQAGVDRLKGQSPDQLTENGTRHLEVAGQMVDSMGTFEWIALTLQEDPKQLSAQDYSWLLANRIDVDDRPRVPSGRWSVDRVRSGLAWADYTHDSVRPRLAVM